MARLAPDEKEIEGFIRMLEAVRPPLPPSLVILLAEFKRQTHLWDLDDRELLDFLEKSNSVLFNKNDLPVGLIHSLGGELSRSIASLSSSHSTVERSCFMVSIPMNLSLSLVNEQLCSILESHKNVDSSACCVFGSQANGQKVSYLIIASNTGLESNLQEFDQTEVDHFVEFNIACL